MGHGEGHTVAVCREALSDLVRRLRGMSVLGTRDRREVTRRVGVGGERDGVVCFDGQLVVLDGLTLLQRRVQVKSPVLQCKYAWQDKCKEHEHAMHGSISGSGEPE